MKRRPQMIDHTQPTTRGKVINCRNPANKFIGSARERVTWCGSVEQQRVLSAAIIVPVTNGTNTLMRQHSPASGIGKQGTTFLNGPLCCNSKITFQTMRRKKFHFILRYLAKQIDATIFIFNRHG
ncbi:hypothetical protein Tcan_01508, partial [Toxocara canis]